MWIIIAAGNVEGISEVEAEMKAPEEKKSEFHIVAEGDSLWKIAAEHYGIGSKYPAIFEANRPMLSHPTKIYPGQVLRIPEAYAIDGKQMTEGRRRCRPFCIGAVPSPGHQFEAPYRF